MNSQLETRGHVCHLEPHFVQKSIAKYPEGKITLKSGVGTKVGRIYLNPDKPFLKFKPSSVVKSFIWTFVHISINANDI